MKKYHSSYKRKKQQKTADLCAKMRVAKERKRLEQLFEPEEERAKNQHALTVVVIDHRSGQAINMKLYESDNIRSFWIREHGKGWWNKTAGVNRVFQYLSKTLIRAKRFS